MNIKYFTILSLIILLIFTSTVFSQDADYKTLIEQKKYTEAIEIIRNIIGKQYGQDVLDVKIPSEYIPLDLQEESYSLLKIYRERKNNPFFIEDRKDLFDLHSSLAKCYYYKNNYPAAINHYHQALRYHNIVPEVDDTFFIELANVYRDAGYYKAYINSLETAYTLSPNNFNYSLKLAEALYTSGDYNRTIYHYQRYLDSINNNVEDKKLLLRVAGLYETVSNYLKAEELYRIYLKDDGINASIWFSIGKNAAEKTGNQLIAIEALNNTIKYADNSDIYRKAKSYELLGDIYYKNIKYENAIESYSETIKFHKQMLDRIDKMNGEIQTLILEINKLKLKILNEPLSEEYKTLVTKNNQLGNLQLDKIRLVDEYNRLNPGKINWQIAYCYEQIEKNDLAIEFYNKTVLLDYKATEGREKIKKIQLKIKRGY